MKPLILDFKVSRSESDNPIIYEYDVRESLNVVVSLKGAKIPFIDLKADQTELMTKTKVNRENDDDSFLCELGTKTEAQRERDDRHDEMLEMSTKTFTTRERDDRHDDLLEMMTKTRMQRERDDESFVDN